MIARPYQAEVIQSLQAMLLTVRSVILQLATGAGKTVIACLIVADAVSRGKRVVILVPRRELAHQFSKALTKLGIAHGIIMAGEPMNIMQRVQVASFDTLNSRAVRRERLVLPKADLVIVDEAHLSIAPSRQKLLRRYASAVIIGLTATPARADGRGLGESYDGLVSGPSVRHLVSEGYLAPARYFAPTKPDLKGLKVVRGDYAAKPLAERMNKPQIVGEITENWLRIAGGLQTVVFCVNCAGARHVHQEFLRYGVRAEYLDGDTPTDERRAILDRISRKESQVLVNVFVATFGLDVPTLECAVLARPTKSLVLYLQMVGRVLRTAEGKREAVIIDHAGAVEEHGFADDDFPWTLEPTKSAKTLRQQQRVERSEPKEITCGECATVFKGQRDCPSCGAELIPPSKPIPVYSADLQELRRNNRQASWEEKARFFSELKCICVQRGYSRGWAAHQYRKKFGVWPNDPRLQLLGVATEVSEETRRWVLSRQIAYAKGKAA